MTESFVFSVVTPCRNAQGLIARTIDSVLAQTVFQNGDASLQYVVVDGNSTDQTVEEISPYLADGRVTLISEDDLGMYDALSKGLAGAHGTRHCYINAGDMFHRAAFSIVDEVFRQSEEVHWLTGADFYYNDRDQVVGFRLPFRYTRVNIRNGLHGTVLPAIQQESTFWRGYLTDELDLDVLRTYRLAGDNYMWSRFAESHDLYVVGAFLGGFTYHGGHLSEDMDGYRLEMRRHALPPTARAQVGARLEAIMWRMPDRLKKTFNPRLLRYDRRLERWS